ncbi:hypothetical protein QVD17_27585 [Tagetes erecta]|uniref:Uncharacterized protein n=1 Tax=Tagetes erecta TaxID=13708 RepID=A0AAD8NJL8_TARER|nr:hypothetical protein QVD17_27585 [Tagetes erecta]
MKPSLMFSLLLVLSIFLYEAQGIRLQKLSIRASNNQEIITKSSSSNQDEEDGSAVATTLSSGINRKLMTKIISSSFTTTNDKNNDKDPNTVLKFTRELVEKEKSVSTAMVSSKHENTEVVSERYPDIIDITGMDYSPAKRKPPIHN